MTNAIVPEPAVTLFTDNADPVVAPAMEYNTCVEDEVMEELVIVNVKSAAAAILTDVNVTLPALVFKTTGLAAAPVAVVALKDKPLPAVEDTKFPAVAVIAPEVAVNVVADVIEPTVVVILPAEATMFPVVAVIPVPAVKVVPEARVVVVVNDPGVVIAEGRDIVAVPALLVTVI